MLKRLLNILFPPRCAHCLKDTAASQALCAPCLASVDLHPSLFCAECDARLPGISKICHKNYPYILGAAARYGNPVIQSAVKSLKFKGVRRAADHLGDMLAAYAKPISDFQGAVAIPLPLSPKRLRERGYNQSELIARRFAKHYDLPILNSALVRVKHAAPQSALDSYKGRWNNIRGAFAVYDPEAIRGKHIVLIDDVTTSGATFFEAASVLKSAGAKKITALAVAKA